jgi:hypothetical protein
MTAPRIFKLMRDTDVSGVSGAGHVADGVVFGDGTTVLRWRSEHRSTAVYASLEDAVAIHGHNGATRFDFGDERNLKLVTEEPEAHHREQEELWAAIDAIKGDPAWNHKVYIKPGAMDILKTTEFRAAVLKILIDESRKRGMVI